jgi:hypothetical protein
MHVDIVGDSMTLRVWGARFKYLKKTKKVKFMFNYIMSVHSSLKDYVI